MLRMGKLTDYATVVLASLAQDPSIFSHVTGTPFFRSFRSEKRQLCRFFDLPLEPSLTKLSSLTYGSMKNTLSCQVDATTRVSSFVPPLSTLKKTL